MPLQPPRAPDAFIRYAPSTGDTPDQSNGTLLAEITYGPRHQVHETDPRRIGIGLAPIGEYARELWRLPSGDLSRGWSDDIGFVIGGGYLFAHLLEHQDANADIALTTYRAYKRLLTFVRRGGCPNILRFWNYIERINDEDAGMERYQAFSKGRADAMNEAGIAPSQFPAATAIGSHAQGLSIHLLAGSAPGVPLENPRQLSAYRYPPPYGPAPPSFARAMRFQGPHRPDEAPVDELAISGTASIVGHVTMHPGDLERQLRETMRNLDLMLPPAGATRPAPNRPLLLKVYLRDPGRKPEVEQILASWLEGPARIRPVQVMYLQGDICRRELEVEIEAHQACHPDRHPAAPDLSRSAHPPRR